MKFLCDNCKAKYQIADDKVAGKTVRMKCRKCGHQIEVRAAVTETSVSTSPPPQPPGAFDPPRAAPPKGTLATSLSAQKPRAPHAGHSHSQPPGALAGAFQRTVHEVQSVPPPHGAPLELSVTDEWYVAINGVPVGPVRISELRRKAGSGAVTEDSLCWQEGLEEWRPVRSIPELAAIVREAAQQGNRPSLIAPPPNEARPSSPPRAPARPAPPPPRPEAGPPRPAAPAAPPRSNVVPLRVAASGSEESAPLTAPMVAGTGAAAALAPSPFGLPAPVYAPQVQPMPPAPFAASDPFAQAPLVGGGQGAFSPTTSTSLVPPPEPKRGGVPLWFWPILVFTGVFGVAAAIFVFRPQPTPAPVVIQMPGTATPSTATVQAKTDTPPVAPTAETSASPSASVKLAAGGPKAAGTASAAPEKKGVDVSSLLGGGAGGPNIGGPGGPGPGGGGLDSSSVERVVASHRAGVKRTCWERGGADQKSSVNVTVSATVAPDGSVSGTSSSGDDPVVAKCIESQVRTWRFNAPGSTTTVNIPFKFVRQ